MGIPKVGDDKKSWTAILDYKSSVLAEKRGDEPPGYSGCKGSVLYDTVNL